jgi:uncharacterized protein YdaU (DUF1376 family)
LPLDQLTRPAYPKRPPFFAFWPADFANDIVVEAMTAEQVGVYILLLCKAWQSDPPAMLPDDDAVLARLARVDPATWDRIKGGVLRAFHKQCTSTGAPVLVQKRLQLEYERAVEHIRRNREKSQKAARARWDNRQDPTPACASGNAQALPEQCPSNARAMPLRVRVRIKKRGAFQPPLRRRGSRGPRSQTPPPSRSPPRSTARRSARRGRSGSPTGRRGGSP